MARAKPIFVEIGQGLSIMAGLPTIASWKTKSRPKNPKRGTIGFNTQTSSFEYWDGKDWFSAALNS